MPTYSVPYDHAASSSVDIFCDVVRRMLLKLRTMARTTPFYVLWLVAWLQALVLKCLRCHDSEPVGYI